MVSFDYLLFMILILFVICIYAEAEASPALAK